MLFFTFLELHPSSGYVSAATPLQTLRIATYCVSVQGVLVDLLGGKDLCRRFPVVPC